jgi:two-component system sensor histidine kinase DegS
MRIFEGWIAPYTEDKTITIVRDITEIIDYQNALKTSQANLQEMTRQIIDIQESERHQIALDLHDQVLSQLGALFLYIDESSIPPKFIENYHKLIDQIRSTIYNLRPPMLNYGLYPALDELRTYLIRQHQSNIPIEFNVTPSNIRVDPNIELHLFRIIQEAMNNACKHSRRLE